LLLFYVNSVYCIAIYENQICFFLNYLDSAIPMNQNKPSLVIMGVAGCGKSSLGIAVARQAGLRLVEGDDHHSIESLRKMRSGVPLTDEDRDGWLAALSSELSERPAGLVLTCSALKRVYRERLRRAAPGLLFVYLDISREEALARVTERAGSHFFSTSLVDSQFAILEVPTAEAGVLRVDALAPTEQLQVQVCTWLGIQT
jgi:gluconokinase